MANCKASPDCGCALRPDGSLKDASEIEWQFDVDNDITPSLSGPSSISGPSSGLSSGDSGPSKIHSFFSSTPTTSSTLQPVTFAAGSRRSGRVTRPSNHILDPNNAMGAGKCPAYQKSAATRNVKQKIIQDDQDDQDSEEDDASFDTPPVCPTELSTDVNDDNATNAVVEEEYESLKAMADADHDVSTCTTLLSTH